MRDRVVRLGLQHLGERGLGLLQLAQLEERAAHAVARLDVVGRRFDDLRVQVRRARPVGLEGGRDGLIREGSHAQSGVRSRCHGSSHSSPARYPCARAVPLRHPTSARDRAERQRGREALDLAVVPQGQFPAVQWAILATRDGERVVRWNELAQEIGHLRLRGRLDTITNATPPARRAAALARPHGQADRRHARREGRARERPPALGGRRAAASRRRGRRPARAAAACRCRGSRRARRRSRGTEAAARDHPVASGRAALGSGRATSV